MEQSDSPKFHGRKMVPIVAMTVILVLLLGAGITYMVSHLVQSRRIQNVYSEVIIEAGTSQLSASQFLKNPDSSEPVFLTDISQIPLDNPGSSRVEFSWHNHTYESILQVIDTVPPEGQVKELTILGKIPDPDEFLTQISDVTPVAVSYKEMPDEMVSDPQRVVIVLTDTSGNSVELDTTLTIVHDITPPVIEGIPETLIAYEGDTISYRKGITVQDDYDENVTLDVNSDQVDLSKVGQYTVVFSATDASGNTTTVERYVQVCPRPAEYVEPDRIWEEIDEIISRIITEKMTVRQQVEAIYQYTRNNFQYGDYDEKTDYLQAAHYMLVRGIGDCYNHFGLAKAMYERLGIPNIDVKKVKNYPADSNHYWSLVSLDGGENYYHVDPTPRIDIVDFCLVTDTFLDRYSADHYGCYNRDISLYPATPEE